MRRGGPKHVRPGGVFGGGHWRTISDRLRLFPEITASSVSKRQEKPDYEKERDPNDVPEAPDPVGPAPFRSPTLSEHEAQPRPADRGPDHERVVEKPEDLRNSREI